MVKKYVVGFAFDENKRRVLLIKKNRPEWQKGKLNGIGGSMEEGETPLETMIREFREETAVELTNWEHYCTRIFKDAETVDSIVHYFRIFDVDLSKCKQNTDEILVSYLVRDTLCLTNPEFVIYNTPWLVSMALTDPHYSIVEVQSKDYIDERFDK